MESQVTDWNKIKAMNKIGESISVVYREYQVNKKKRRKFGKPWASFRKTLK